jgi:Ca-activated chloride channel homolog
MKFRILALAGALALAGCAGPSPDPAPTPSPTPEEPTPSSEPSASPEVRSAFVDPRVPVQCEVDREPTEVERSLLVEPGPFAVDFDADAAAAAVLELNPTTAEEWSIAILATVQGDHAEAVCGLMKFEFDLGEAAAKPAGASDTAPQTGSRHFAIALDASGSMAAKSGGTTRMEQAKSAIQEFVSGLPEGSTVSLRVYGHEGNNQESGKVVSCESSEVVYTGASADPAFVDRLAAVEPVGWTPLGLAIGDAAADIPDTAHGAIVYVVSDGLETCGGDPVEAAQDLAATGVKPVINVIGFEIGDDERDALEAVADAGGGSYVHASSADELHRYWSEERQRARLAWHDWRQEEWARLREQYERHVQPARDARANLPVGIWADDWRANSLERYLRSENLLEHDVWGDVIDLNHRHTEAALAYAKAPAVTAAIEALKVAHDEAREAAASGSDEYR